MKMSADELLSSKPLKIEHASDGPETRRPWKRFQMLAVLPERDQRAVIRLVESDAGEAVAEVRCGDSDPLRARIAGVRYYGFPDRESGRHSPCPGTRNRCRDHPYPARKRIRDRRRGSRR